MALNEAEIARLQRRVREDPRSTAFVGLADALRRSGKGSEALQVLREGLRTHPDHPSARVVLARLHLDQGNAPLAIGVLSEVVQADPENLAALSLLARLYVDTGRLKDARPLIERLRNANHPDAGLPEFAGVGIESAVEGPLLARDPFDRPSLAARFLALGHLGRARRVWERIAVDNPDASRVVDELALLGRMISGEVDTPTIRLPGFGELDSALADDTVAPLADVVGAHGKRARLIRWAAPFWRSA